MQKRTVDAPDVIISPSIPSADFAQLGAQIKALQIGSSDMDRVICTLQLLCCTIIDV